MQYYNNVITSTSIERRDTGTSVCKPRLLEGNVADRFETSLVFTAREFVNPVFIYLYYEALRVDLSTAKARK